MSSLKDLGPASPADHRLLTERAIPGLGRRSIIPPLSSPSGLRDPIIRDERTWRRPDIPRDDRRHQRLFASRWSGANWHEQTSEIAGDYYMLSITLQPSKFSLRLGTAWFPNTEVIPGSIQLTRPAQPARIAYHKPYDVLHLYIQETFLGEYVEWSHGTRPKGSIAIRDPRFSHDPVFGQLGLALLSADKIGGSHGELYADSLSLAIVARLFARYAETPASTPQGTGAGLPAWRLRRVIDFIESHVDRPVSLADLAQTAGLSRMHFAAQFRKATGVRPHEFLQRRRVEKAKVLLAAGSMPIAEVALAVGFSSQAHFTGVFKRFAGLAPRQWRESNRR